MKVPWATIECPDDEAESHDKRNSGENYILKFRASKPPATVAIISAKSMDERIAKRGVLDGEENGETVSEVVNEWADSKLRRPNH